MLDPAEEPVDSKGQGGDDDQYENNMFRQAPSLARGKQIAQPMLRVDQFGQHYVAESQTE